ncbi:MAG: hypothetical protein ABWK05_01440 [Pyrobaculum sp.]
MKTLIALVVATIAYAAMLGLTFLLLFSKTPPAHKRLKKSELAVLVTIPLLFFVLGYLFLKGLS